MTWISKFDKPLIISEFGGEALFGNNTNPKVASTWSEDYLVQIYKDQSKMFEKIPYLRGLTYLVFYTSYGYYTFYIDSNPKGVDLEVVNK